MSILESPATCSRSTEWARTFACAESTPDVEDTRFEGSRPTRDFAPAWVVSRARMFFCNSFCVYVLPTSDGLTSACFRVDCPCATVYKVGDFVRKHASILTNSGAEPVGSADGIENVKRVIAPHRVHQSRNSK